MKVVINGCYGGFGLSSEAILALIKMNSPILDKVPFGEKGGWNKKEFTKNFKEGYKEWIFNGIIADDNYVYSFDCSGNRSHPDLIKVVEELGEKANGTCAKLEIIEIPDDVKYEIDEYDGSESIHEVHRSWR